MHTMEINTKEERRYFIFIRMLIVEPAACFPSFIFYFQNNYQT